MAFKFQVQAQTVQITIAITKTNTITRTVTIIFAIATRITKYNHKHCCTATVIQLQVQRHNYTYTRHCTITVYTSTYKSLHAESTSLQGLHMRDPNMGIPYRLSGPYPSEVGSCLTPGAGRSEKTALQIYS